MTLAEMRRRYRAGYNLAEISVVAGCAASTVARTLHLAGEPLRSRGTPGALRHRARVAERNRELLDRIGALYYGERLTCVEVGRRVGRSHTHVHNLMRAAGWKLRAGVGRSA